jgi:starvation-inducible DNA-binding protein
VGDVDDGGGGGIPIEHRSFLPPIPGRARAQVGARLQHTLTELIQLALVGRQLHWNAVGPRLRALQLELDECVDAWRSLADAVAERLVTIGVPTDWQATAIIEATTAPVPRGVIHHDDAARALALLLAEVTERIRERLAVLEELDAVSQGTLVDVAGTLEQHLWMLQAQLP